MTPESFQEQKLLIDDFSGMAPKGVTHGAKTTKHQAGVQSLLSGEGLDGYESNIPKVAFPESREDFIKEQMGIRDSIWENSKGSIVNIISDDTVDDETKFRSVEAVRDNVKTTKPDTMFTLVEQTINAPVKDVDEETETDDFSKNYALDQINNIVLSKRKAQQAINAYRASREASTTSGVVDVAEIMVPFAEWAYYNRVEEEFVEDEDQKFFLGQKKQEIFNSLKDLTVAERAEVVEGLIDYVDSNDSVLLPDGNDLVAVDVLEKMMQLSDYGDFERWFDNVTTVLDMSGVGAIIRGGAKALKASGKAAKASEKVKDAGEFKVTDLDSGKDLEVEILRGEVSPEFSKASDDYFRSDVDPSSTAMVIRDSNPDLAREVHELVARSPEEASEALYGAPKVQSMGDDLLPDAGDGSKIRNKPDLTYGPKNQEDPVIKRIRERTGNLEFTDAEREAVRQRKKGLFSNVQGLRIKANTSVVKYNEDGSLGITARYATSSTNYRSGAEAYTDAVYRLTKQGVPEENISIYKKQVGREGVEWGKMSKDDILKSTDQGEFEIAIDYNHSLSAYDLEVDELLTTGSSWISRAVQFLDRIPPNPAGMVKSGQGSFVQNMLDPASVIHPQIHSAANVAVDKGYSLRNHFVTLFEDFTETYNGLGKDRRVVMSEYIKEANLEGIPFDEADLARRGFNEKEIRALKKWRYANDTMWYAANDDMVKTLRAKGFKAFVHEASGTKLYGKPTKSVSGDRMVYDPVHGDFYDAATATKEVKKNGITPQYIELTNPVKIDDVWVDHVLVRDTVEGGYFRDIFRDEHVLSYRDGYYPVMYDANYFIERSVKMSDGTMKQVVVSTARNKKELKDFRDNVMRKEGLSVEEFNKAYKSRKDRSFDRNSSTFDEGSWSMASSGSVTSQRVRGERLIDSGQDMSRITSDHLKDPLEAISSQVVSLSNRVSMRDWLETAKTRWMQSYSEFMDIPPDISGKPSYPLSPSQLKGRVDAPPSMVQQARTNYNYINQMENGFINLIDEGYKGVMHVAADLLSSAGMFKAEEAAMYSSRVRPSAMSKNFAFRMYISSNPARQAVIQRAQMLLVPYANPQYVATGAMVSDMWQIRKAQTGAKVSKKVQDLFDEIKDEGVLGLVKSNQFVREEALNLAEFTTMQKAGKLAGKPLDKLQEIGFDFAESDVLLSAYLVFRDKAVRAGKNIRDQRVRDQIMADMRNFTLNMNRAGDPAYTQNTLSVPLQFLSFQHKALLQGLSNSNIKGVDRGKFVIYSAALFGTSAVVATSLADYIFSSDEPSETKDIVRDGLVDLMLNKSFSALTGEEQELDFGILSPTDPRGFSDSITGLVSMEPLKLITESPSGSLLFGSDSRTQTMFRTAGQYFAPAFTEWWTGIPIATDDSLSPRAEDVVWASLDMYSGMSNSFKAIYAMKTGQKMASSGNISDYDVTKFEAMMALPGFPTKDEEGMRSMYSYIYGNKSKQFESDFEEWYVLTKKTLARRGDSVTETDMRRAISGEAMRVFGQNRPRAVAELNRLLKRDLDRNDETFLNGIRYQMGLKKEEEVLNILNKLRGEPKERAMEVWERIQRINEL